MALLNPQTVTPLGPTITFQAAGSIYDAFVPVPRGILRVRTAGTITTVAITIPGTDRYGLARPDISVALPATGEKDFGPFDSDAADAVTGLVTFTCTPITAVTVAYTTQ